MKNHVAKGDVTLGITYELECKFIDLRAAKLEQIIDYIKVKDDCDHEHEHEQPNFRYTMLDLSKLVNNIAQSRFCDLEAEELIRDLIDSTWHETQWWQMVFFVIYIIGYMIPFFMQIFSSDKIFVITSNCICLVSVLTLFVYEFVQMRGSGFDEYIDDFWNQMDVCNITFYIVYFPIRMYLSSESLLDFFSFEDFLTPDDPHFASHYHCKFFLVMLNVILVPITVMKLLNYLRLAENFGLFVLLIGHCLNEVKIFFLFMFMWIFIFNAILYILNTDTTIPEDYPMLPMFLRLLVQVWRDSLGDIQPP